MIFIYPFWRDLLSSYLVPSVLGGGVKTINITEKTGNLVAIKQVSDEDDLMIMNRSGLTIRMHVCDLRVLGRATQGVRLINIKEGDAIASVTEISKEEDDETIIEENTTLNQGITE